ncbi:MAG: bifunctional precorrin-2 dehydrogenase/sirohydrochlorin ferrochelatase [Candidatus Omnitrophica bacterium]|nr:bifunctional precorrin-2 dehydrogenase/sirohydrochlorin ferrochelatase [Candidatus Omnitrophota bacterium]MBU4479277.1 bifunctional precorrin-2 dehydrogenase/sirohydrochlorin ferrochelatase [Candidatus Omnitrophota bacterium]MCG2703258.1 bifunctional precorrin-2 dehydrogenase/sirohydrochlorin ferrochelatase [Candidatus Omnitrophota bacterium]
MNLYPICLKLENIPCLVIGGGTVALRKVRALLKSGAKVTIVSPRLCPGLRKLEQKKAFEYLRGTYKKTFLKNILLVISAADEPQVNAAAGRDAASKRLWVNVVDDPDASNFYVPAVMERHSLLIAISTQGNFPGLSKKIRQECRPLIERYARNLKTLGRLRQEVKRVCRRKGEKQLLLKKLLDPQVLLLIEKKRIRGVPDLRKYVCGN